MIWIILYIIIAAVAVFVLTICAAQTGIWDQGYDFPWPVICGIFWPVAAPIAAAYIAAKWFLDIHTGA